MEDISKGLLLGLIFSTLILTLGFVSAEETPKTNWYNDTIYNDSCIILKSDQATYIRLDNQPVTGQLQIINSCGKVFENTEIKFYGANDKNIQLTKITKYDGTKETPIEIKQTENTTTTHRTIVETVNQNKLKLDTQTLVIVNGKPYTLEETNIMTKPIPKETLDTQIKPLNLTTTQESIATIGLGVTYYNFTIQPEQESGEFAIELKGLSVLDPTYYSYDGNIITGGVYNPGFEYGTGSTGTSEWIGDANYGWRTGSVSATNGVIVSFDTTIKNTGLQSLKIISDNNRIRITNIGSTSTISLLNEKPWTMIPVKPSTNYNLCYSTQINTNDGNGLTLLVSGVSSTFATANPTFNQLTPKQSVSFVRQCTPVITSSTTKYLRILFYSGFDSASNNTGTSYLDAVRLEEVKPYNLSSQAVGVPSITITGVTDTNAIDQADTNNSTQQRLGESSTKYVAQQFLPTQSKLTGISFQRGSDTNTYEGNVTISIKDTNTDGNIGTKTLAQVTYTNAQWSALSQSIDTFVALSAILDANGTNKYWIVWYSDTNIDTNYTRLKQDSSGNGYTKGLVRYADYTQYWKNAANSQDIYFKTHFAKLSSSTDMNVVNADGSSSNFVLNMPEILTDANITIRPDGSGSLTYKPVYKTATTNFKYAFYTDFFDQNQNLSSGYWNFWVTNGLAIAPTASGFNYVTNRITAPKGCTFTGNATYKPYVTVTAGRSLLLQHSNNNSTWITDENWVANNFFATSSNMYVDGNTQFYVKLLGDTSTTYMTFAQIDANFTCTGLTYPRFEFGDNNTLIMQTNDFNWAGDGDVINKTPSMMQKMYYTFDKPTTTINTDGRTTTLTCTPGTTGTCNNTYYRIDSGAWTTYTGAFNTTGLNSTITYYSTDNSGNQETTQTYTLTGTETISCTPGILTNQMLQIISAILIILVMLVLANTINEIKRAQKGHQIEYMTIIMGITSIIIGTIILNYVLQAIC